MEDILIAVVTILSVQGLPSSKRGFHWGDRWLTTATEVCEPPLARERASDCKGPQYLAWYRTVCTSCMEEESPSSWQQIIWCNLSCVERQPPQNQIVVHQVPRWAVSFLPWGFSDRPPSGALHEWCPVGSSEDTHAQGAAAGGAGKELYTQQTGRHQCCWHQSSSATHEVCDIGFLAQKALSAADVSDRDRLEFRMQAKDFVVKMVAKLLEKIPVSYQLLMALSCLNSNLMATDSSLCRAFFKRVIDSLLRTKRVAEQSCDAIISEYEVFLDSIPQSGSAEFTAYNWRKDRLDNFLLPRIKSLGQYAKLEPVLRMLLVLSHGQATVERGFSVNKELEVENLQERSLVAQRLVCDYVQLHGGVTEVHLTKALLQSVWMSHQRYKQHWKSSGRPGRWMNGGRSARPPWSYSVWNYLNFWVCNEQFSFIPYFWFR